jgi:biotin carboxyl carrier protein
MQPLQNPAPEPRPSGPQPARPLAPARPSRGRKALAYLALIVFGLALGTWALRDKFFTDTTGAGPVVTALRTSVVAEDNLDRTIRLTGTTTAEKFMALQVPQLRGSRGGSISISVSRGMGGMTVQIASSGGPMGGGGGDRGGGGGDRGGDRGGGGGDRGGGGSSSGSSASTSASGAVTSVSSTAEGSSGGGSGGFRGSSSSRFGSSSSSGATTTTAASSTRSSGSGSGSSGRGSAGAASGGFGGGDLRGMSGGAGDFMQVLQSVAKAGSIVKKGDIVAEFDRQYQTLRLDDNKAAVDQRVMNMRRMEVEMDVTAKQRALNIASTQAAVDKAKLDIKTIPVRSAIQSEQLRLALEEAEARLKMLKEQEPLSVVSQAAERRDSEIEFQNAKNEYKRAQDNVDKMILRAPMDGMVVMQNTIRGNDFNQIQQGDQLYPGQTFMQIVEPNSMVVSATVNQADVELMRIGARARLNFDAFPGLSLPGHVVAIGAMTKPGGQRASYFREVPVYLKLDAMDPRVIPDLSVSVDVVVDSAPRGVIAPLESVFHDPADGKAYVYVKAGDRYVRREVVLGLRNNICVRITGGLNPGEAVALEEPKTNQTPPAGAAST